MFWPSALKRLLLPISSQRPSLDEIFAQLFPLDVSCLYSVFFFFRPCESFREWSIGGFVSRRLSLISCDAFGCIKSHLQCTFIIITDIYLRCDNGLAFVQHLLLVAVLSNLSRECVFHEQNSDHYRWIGSLLPVWMRTSQAQIVLVVVVQTTSHLSNNSIIRLTESTDRFPCKHILTHSGLSWGLILLLNYTWCE